METTEGNKLIAEFMGIESYEANGYTNFIFEDDNHRTHVDLHYHGSWDWLMPVVVEIGDKTEYELSMGYGYSYFNKFADNPLNKEFGGYSNITAIWQAVVEFIQWYNDQK